MTVTYFRAMSPNGRGEAAKRCSTGRYVNAQCHDRPPAWRRIAPPRRACIERTPLRDVSHSAVSERLHLRFVGELLPPDRGFVHQARLAHRHDGHAVFILGVGADARFQSHRRGLGGKSEVARLEIRHACNLAANGYLGKVHTIEVGAPGGMAYPVAPPCEVPEGFDYDRWTGPAPMIPFDSRRCEWLAMYMISHYCAGFITNWGVHHLDIAGWGIAEVFEKPFTIEGTGTMPTEGMTDTWVDWQCHLNWESGLKMHYTNSNNPVKQGCRFIGDEGWVWVNRHGIHASSPSILETRMGPNDKPLHESPNCGDRYGYTAHTADFFRSMRTRQDPISPVEAGHAASTLGNVSDIALHLGRKLTWDPTAGQFVGDADANTILTRTHRSPWTI